MIIKVPDKRLYTICTDCRPKEAKEIQRKLIKEIKIAYEEQKKVGNIVVGLAAPQIGITKRAFAAFGRVFINPEIIWHSNEEIPSKEGCLSLEDGDTTTRKRYYEVCLRSYSAARSFTQEIFNDSAAVVIQHEMDHLNGVMCNEY